MVKFAIRNVIAVTVKIRKRNQTRGPMPSIILLTKITLPFLRKFLTMGVSVRKVGVEKNIVNALHEG